MISYQQYKTYNSQPNDRWDTIAYEFYGDCYNFSPLLEANPSVAISPFIPAGTELIIPVLDITEQNQDLPPWKQ